MCEGRHLEEDEATGLSRSPRLREGQGFTQCHSETELELQPG